MTAAVQLNATQTDETPIDTMAKPDMIAAILATGDSHLTAEMLSGYSEKNLRYILSRRRNNCRRASTT